MLPIAVVVANSLACYIFISFHILWYTKLVMALSIKSLDVERLARELAEKTGDSLTRVIQKALEQSLERLKRDRRSQILAGQLDEILRRVDEMPDIDSRCPDEIIGYDEFGLPR